MDATLTLLPGQAVKPPPRDLAALMLLIECALEAFAHVVDLVESSLLQRATRIDRSLATAADEHYRPIHAGDFLEG